MVKGTVQKSLLNGAAVTGTGNHELVIGKNKKTKNKKHSRNRKPLVKGTIAT